MEGGRGGPTKTALPAGNAVFAESLFLWGLRSPQALGKPRFFPGGGVFVDNALGGRRVELDLGLPNFGLGAAIPVLNRADCPFCDRTGLGAHEAITLAPPQVLANLFFSGICICQFQFLR